MAAQIWKSDRYGLSLSFYGSSVMTVFEFILSRNLFRALRYPGRCAHPNHDFTKPEIYSKLISICKEYFKAKVDFRDCCWLPVADQIVSKHLSLAHTALTTCCQLPCQHNPLPVISMATHSRSLEIFIVFWAMLGPLLTLRLCIYYVFCLEYLSLLTCMVYSYSSFRALLVHPPSMSKAFLTLRQSELLSSVFMTPFPK